MSGESVVIVEDEPDIVEVMSYNLNREGFKVTTVTRGDEAFETIRGSAPALVLLDLMLPGLDGLAVCRRLKSESGTRRIPVIIVSAKGEESDVVAGLELGADDYLAKPFGPRELLARVKAVLRRSGGPEPGAEERLVLGDLVVDGARREVLLAGRPLSLTAREFRLLFQLASQPGRAFTREQLLDGAFGQDAVVVDRNIDVHIRSIRKKLGAHADMIQTVRGVGYRFVE